MLILTNTGTDKLQLTTDQAVTIDVHASWVDEIPNTSTTPGNTNTNISTATTTDIVATPSASTERIVKHINIANRDGSLSCTVTVLFDKNGTDTQLFKVTLLAGEVLEYQEGIGWFVVTTDRDRVPTLPVFVAASAEFTSTGAPTAVLPTGHLVNDILVLVLQSSNESIATPTGYTQLGPQNGIGTAVTAGSLRMGIFWKRDNGAEVAPTIADSGDHTYGVMLAIRGCPTTGDPFQFLGNTFKFTASTTGTSPKGVTSVDNMLIMDIFAHAIDSATAQASAAANADLSSVTEQFDDSTTDGTGGGIAVVTGIKYVAGAIGATTLTWASSTSDLCSRIGWIPADISNNSFSTRPARVEVFIGSPQDTDDTWVKPASANRVFVQLCDGGGSGSSGHTVTTAAGGGGGGGGGYDEAWYDPDSLAATITLHAGKGGAATTAAVDQAGNPGVISEFNKGGAGPLTSNYRVAGTAATAAASADGGDGGCGSGRGTASPATAATRIALNGVAAGAALGWRGGAGGSGTTAPTGGSPAENGGGGGESGGDTDAATTNLLNGYSLRGGGGGGSGRTVQAAGSPHPAGGGAASTAYAVGAAGVDSTLLPYGGSGGCGGDSTTAPGGAGGFPGGGGGGGGGNNAGTQGGRGGHGCVVVTTFF
jgi:hypothetical protein